MIKGILFDKDGTLIDFSLWRNAGIKVIKKIMNEYGLNDEKLFRDLQNAVGITENGVDPFGALAYRSHEDMAGELHFILKKYREIDLAKFQSHVSELLKKEVLRDDVEFEEITDLRALFEHLKSNGIKIGLATADSRQSAMYMINKLKLNDYFDFIGSYDGVMKPKPHNDMCVRFCRMHGLTPDQVAIVGDSYNDMVFAKNSGAVGVGVLSGVSCKINLKDAADLMIPSVNLLFDEGVLKSLNDVSSQVLMELKTA